jgi:tetratricopeptide (TPR) repeat protein
MMVMSSRRNRTGVPFALWILGTLICFSSSTQSRSQATPLSDTATVELQHLLDAETAARNSGDPAQVAASAQKLTEIAEQQVKATTSALAQPNLSLTRKKQLRIRQQQLRQILSSGFNDWGTAEARQQQYAEALGYFQQAEKWDNTTPGLMRNLGMAAFRLQNYSEAVRALKQVVDTDSSDQSARLMLAMSFFSLEKFSDAANQFAAINDLAMRDTRTAYAWAFSLARTNQQQQANQIADNLAARNLTPDVRFLVCQLYTTTENYDHAVPCFRKLSSGNPEMPRVHYELGATLIRLDRPAEAVPELRAELKISPNDTDAQYDLAYALLETSQRDEALTLLKQVVAEKPTYFQAQYELGKTLLEDGKTTDAIEHLEAAAKLDPAADYIHYQLQSAYRRAGRTEAADHELAIYKQIKASHRNNGPPHETTGP